MRTRAMIGACLIALSGCGEIDNSVGDGPGQIIVAYPAQGAEYETPPSLIAGHGEPGLSCCQIAQLSLRRLSSDGSCAWWSRKENRFIEGNCGAHLWNHAWNFVIDGREREPYVWAVRAPELAPGRYQAAARARPRPGPPCCSGTEVHRVSFEVKNP